jgi:hypothetical protein
LPGIADGSAAYADLDQRHDGLLRALQVRVCRMIDERRELELAMQVVITSLPRISRGVINASQSSRPLPWRKQQLAESIRRTRALLDDLLLRQVTLGWRDREGDAA